MVQIDPSSIDFHGVSKRKIFYLLSRKLQSVPFEVLTVEEKLVHLEKSGLYSSEELENIKKRLEKVKELTSP